MSDPKIHPSSPIGRAKAIAKAATTTAQVSAVALHALEQTAAHAHQQLAKLEATPVSLSAQKLEQELKIHALSRGLSQQDARIASVRTTATVDEQERERAEAVLEKLKLRLTEAQNKLALLADELQDAAATVLVRDRRGMIEINKQIIAQLTAAPAVAGAVDTITSGVA